MKTVLVVSALLGLVWLSTPSAGQSHQIWALDNFTVIENATHLILYWTEPQEAPTFINYIAVYEQADPNHAIRNDYVSPSELNLAQDEASKAYSISKAHLVEGGYFGPLLIHVRGQSGGASWNTEEVLYNPTETDQTAVQIELQLYWRENSLDCGTFMEKVSAQSIATELEYVIRKQSTWFHLEAKIENSHYFCVKDGVVFQAVLHAAGNATEYKGLLYDWFSSESSYLILHGYRYSVSRRHCGLQSDEVTSGSSMCETVMEQNAESDVIEQSRESCNGYSAMVVACISLAMNAVLALALTVYILVDKCVCRSWKTAVTRSSSRIIAARMSSNGKGTVSNEEEAYVDMQ